MSERIYYVIGDVHGEFVKLRALHDMIEAHRSLAASDSPATIVHLGDYVDRGPESRAVVNRLIEVQSNPDRLPGFDIVCLLGNHERMMVDALESIGTGNTALMVQWVMNGGEQTLESYKRADAHGAAPDEPAPRAHIEWMKGLPVQVVDRDAGLLFVHAGVEPAKFPDCTEEVRLWTRSPRFMNDKKWPSNAALDGLTVVHGHTPTEGEPYVGPRRVNLDTGACYGGPLTAAVFRKDAPVEFLRARI
jgi:serine/threonine protein phosphatase 1